MMNFHHIDGQILRLILISKSWRDKPLLSISRHLLRLELKNWRVNKTGTKQQQQKLRYEKRELRILNAGANTAQRKRKSSLNFHVLFVVLSATIQYNTIKLRLKRGVEWHVNLHKKWTLYLHFVHVHSTYEDSPKMNQNCK